MRLFFIFISSLYNIGNISATSDTIDFIQLDTLQAATITQGIIKSTPDGFHISIAGQERFKNLNTIEAISIIPGIVRKEDRLSVKGNDVKFIYVDNHKVSFSDLESIPSGMIQSINVKSTNSVKQDISDAGATIYIKLKPLATSGYILNIQNQTGFRDNGFSHTKVNLPIQARMGNLSIYNSLKYSYMDEHHDYIKEETYNDNSYFYGTEMSREHHHTISEAINLSYKISPQQTLGTIFSIDYIDSSPMSNIYSNRPYSGYSSIGHIKNTHLQGAISYKYDISPEESYLNTTIDYLYSDINKIYTHQYSLNDNTLDYSESNFAKNISIKGETEYDKIISRTHEINIGMQGYYINAYKKSVYIDQNYVADFHLKGCQGSAYMVYNADFYSFLLSAGLRIQYDRVFHSSGDKSYYRNNFLRLCPNVTLKYLFGKNNASSIEASITKDGGEIPFTMLSPLPKQVDAYSYSVGNKYLKPWKGYDANLSLSLRDELFITYMLTYGEDLINDLTYVEQDGSNVSYTKPINDGQEIRHCFNIGFNRQLAKWCLINLDLSAYWAKYSYSDVQFKDRGFDVYAGGTFNLPLSIRLLVNAYYISPYQRVEYWHNRSFGIHTKVVCPLFKQKVHLSLECRNIISNLNEWKTWDQKHSYASFNKHMTNGRLYNASIIFVFKSKADLKNHQRSRNIQSALSEYD